MHYRIVNGANHIDPWRFAVKRRVVYLVDYYVDGDPAVLEPVMVGYSIVKATL